MDSILSLMTETARKSPSCQKHASVLMKHRRIVSPIVYNEGPMHAEMKCIRSLVSRKGSRNRKRKGEV